MDEMSVLFDEMEEKDRAKRWCDGLVAEKVMDSLIWIDGQDEEGEVRAYSILNDQWEIIKKKEEDSGLTNDKRKFPCACYVYPKTCFRLFRRWMLNV